jgi:hypothetical protein
MKDDILIMMGALHLMDEILCPAAQQSAPGSHPA